MVTRFLSLPELSPGAGSEPMTARVGDVLYIVDDTRLNAVDLAGPRLLWERKSPRPTPEYYRVPRRIRAYGGRVWADAHRVICLQDTEGGVAAIACDPRSGETSVGRSAPRAHRRMPSTCRGSACHRVE